jgi:hypothetical protein
VQPIHGNGLPDKKQWSQPQRGAPTVFPSLIKRIKIFMETNGSYLADVRNGGGVLSITGKVVASLRAAVYLATHIRHTAWSAVYK